MRLAKEIKPQFIFLENVPAITSRGGLRVVREIAKMGYDCRWCVISAASVGALHRRERWFLLAHSKYNGSSTCEDRRGVGSKYEKREQKLQKDIGAIERTSGISANVSDTESERLEGFGKRAERTKKAQSKSTYCGKYESIDEWKEAVSTMGKFTNGIPCYVDRIKCLGNAVVPQQAKEAFEILMGIK